MKKAFIMKIMAGVLSAGLAVTGGAAIAAHYDTDNANISAENGEYNAEDVLAKGSDTNYSQLKAADAENTLEESKTGIVAKLFGKTTVAETPEETSEEENSVDVTAAGKAEAEASASDSKATVSNAAKNTTASSSAGTEKTDVPSTANTASNSVSTQKTETPATVSTEKSGTTSQTSTADKASTSTQAGTSTQASASTQASTSNKASTSTQASTSDKTSTSSTTAADTQSDATANISDDYYYDNDYLFNVNADGTNATPKSKTNTVTTSVGVSGTIIIPSSEEPVEEPKQEETTTEEPKQEETPVETPVYKYGCSCGYLATSYDEMINHMKGHVLRGEAEHFGTVYN
jgi:hypothetical protein